ncbi:hypothetical protein CJU90_0873 [Yarrowia sp. C11]|nr:hypothetical protein CKK34_2285 [Yarrowia sp. E02]KAG5373195.1 hypothetical protein CJU90_0873 [Yarrowia sp. C11]
MSLQRKKQKQPVEAPAAQRSNSFQQYLDDDQRDQLASIGMGVRKSVSDGHKTAGTHNASLRHESFTPVADVQNPLRGTYGPASSLGGYITKSFSAAPELGLSSMSTSYKDREVKGYKGIGAEKYSLNRNKPIAALPPRKKRGRSETEKGSDDESEKEVEEVDDAGFPIIKLQPRESFQD